MTQGSGISSVRHRAARCLCQLAEGVTGNLFLWTWLCLGRGRLAVQLLGCLPSLYNAVARFCVSRSSTLCREPVSVNFVRGCNWLDFVLIDLLRQVNRDGHIRAKRKSSSDNQQCNLVFMSHATVCLRAFGVEKTKLNVRENEEMRKADVLALD